MKKKNLNILASLLASLGSVILLTGSESAVLAQSISGTDFEDGSLQSWNLGSQTGSLTNGVISQNGTGVTLITGPVTFNAPSHGGAGSPTLPNGSENPYYQPPVQPATWSFGPYGTNAVALQPNSQFTFDQASVQLGLSSAEVAELKALLSAQASASGYGSGTPTDASWITKSVTLSAGTTYTMSWKYIGTDYVPFNDGSITSLVGVGSASGSSVVVNNGNKSYALLGFTNPGTGDYSTGTFGSTGWQVSTYQVSVTGEYLLGFAVFNLDDNGLSPVLLVDSEPGSTTKNGEPFGAVAPNNPDAPTVPPSTDAPTTTEPTTTLPPDPCADNSCPPEETEPPSTDAPETTAPAPETTTTAPTTTEATSPAPDSPETTTTIPVEPSEPPTTMPQVPETSAPTGGHDGSQLPVTGTNSDTASVAFLMLLSGLVLFASSRLRREH